MTTAPIIFIEKKLAFPQRCAIFQSIAPPLLISDPENATTQEFQKVLINLFARLKSDRTNLADDETISVQ